LLLLALVVSALLYYKWGASLRAVATVQASGKLAVSPSLILDGGVLATTLAYFKKIWPALAYGILIGAAVRAAIPGAWIRRWLGGEGARPTVAGALAGAPLMLCSCCITPVFTGVHQRGARLGPSLALMLAAPGLNVAAVTLTFALLPMRVALLRVVAALVIVLGLSALIGRTLEKGVVARSAPASCELEEDQMTWRDIGIRFAKSVLYLAAITVPLIVAGVLLSGLLLPHVTGLTEAGIVVGVAIVALIGTLAALPTFFEIPIALVLISLGAPLPVVVAFVVAGPVVNLPSLLVLGRETRPRVALALAAGVWAIATLSGLVAMV
jgi:uncharacterized membrane protein YraQ (UPF0718 family)